MTTGRHGITANEQKIMDLFEAGLTRQQIADQLGHGYAYVRQVVCRYDFGTLGKEMSAGELATRQSDRMYQLALFMSGGRFA